ncbi:MAG: MBL fold metallo-hydrolase [Acidimicrobiales bacterium]|jgi:glyoxylase-like metal-dependent hydrolase (beta-lactamase superfamily II)|nr:MBL fold metallo-hydrolase [Acidimicrobiales bacterium]
MARPDQRHPDNVEGDWFVDTRCIECDAARHYAPGLIGSRHGLSVVQRQPETAEEDAAMWRAALCCPTQSIGTISRRRAPEGVFPWELADGIHLCGYNDPSSYGAHSYLAVRPEGNLLVDSPRFTRRLAEPVDALGGVDHVLLTHRDDVADAERWAERYGARVWIHAEERSAAPFATDLVEGDEPVEVRPGLRIVPAPGHTRGHVVFHLEDRYLFTGDTLHWNHRRGELDVFPNQTWYSWEVLTATMARLGELRVDWVLPGHGKWGRVGAQAYREQLASLATGMAALGRAGWAARPNTSFA